MSSARFKDHFSGQARDYARHRPRYPDALFAWLAAQTPSRRTAWDCATGNGQAAVGLAKYFDTVIATDASPQQLTHALPAPGIEYRLAAAENSGLQEQSVDLVTVGQALHWFDLPLFYREVKRVCKSGGIIAVWMYGLFQVSKEIDNLLNRFYQQPIGTCWPPERRHIDTNYTELAFPFTELNAPRLEMKTFWLADEALGYLETWSAVQRFWKEHGENPLLRIRTDLEEYWGPSPRRVIWPLEVRVGRI